MWKSPLLFVLIIFFSVRVSGQEVANIKADLLDANIVRIGYDLKGAVPGQLFTVTILSSANQFKLPLEYVDGYVGERVEAGINKFIDWDISKELVAFQGELTFEIRAELTFTPINLTFPGKKSITRGKQHIITWSGTNTGENVDIQLFRGGRKISTIVNTINDGQYEWTIPFSEKPGKGYSVKIFSTSSSQTNTGSEFTIHRKIPLLVKLIPFAILTPIVINLTKEDPVVPKILPAPPNTPN